MILLAKLIDETFPGAKTPALQERRILWNSRLSLPVWLIFIVIHFDWPKQMRERELGELPLAVFLDIHLSHHKRIGDFVLTDCCLQINVNEQDGCVTKYASVNCVNCGFFVPDATAFNGS